MFTNESIEEFLTTLFANGNSDHTIRAYKADLTGFLNSPLDLSLPVSASLDSRIKLYLTTNQPTWSPRTTKRKVSSFRAFGRHHGMNLLVGYRTPKPPKPIPHPIPEGVDGVLDMLMATDSPEQRALVALCGLCGLRVTEARAITPASLDRHRGIIMVPGKGKKYRTVPLTDTAWAFIKPRIEVLMNYEHLLATTPLVEYSDRGARLVLKNLAVKAGLSTDLASHDLRATFATAAYNKCKDLRVVQELLGHSSSDTTECYTGVKMDAMRSAAEVA